MTSARLRAVLGVEVAAVGRPPLAAEFVRLIERISRENPLWKPLVRAYVFLALFGVVVVAVCIVIMHLGG